PAPLLAPLSFSTRRSSDLIGTNERFLATLSGVFCERARAAAIRHLDSAAPMQYFRLGCHRDGPQPLCPALGARPFPRKDPGHCADRKSTRLNSSHVKISCA